MVPINSVLDAQRRKRDIRSGTEGAKPRASGYPRRKRMHDTIQKTLATVLEDNAKEGTHRVAREFFTDPEIFEIEMKHIFEGNWIYLAHESQIPNKNDYLTTYMGRQPIFIARHR